MNKISSKKDLLEYQEMNHLGVPEYKVRDINMMIRTSGSTGNPLSIPMNNIDIKKITDVGARCFNNAGVTKGMRIIHCLNFQMWAGGVLDFMSLLKAGAAAFPYGVGDTKNLIDTIMYYDIEGISCTPSYMRRIKEVLKKEFNMKPNQLGLRYGFFGGESGLQDPNFRKCIEEEWEIEALNANYGSADSISILASENYNTKDGLVFLANEITDAYILVDGKLTTPRKGLIGDLVISTKYDSGLIQRNVYNIGDTIEVLSDGINFKFKVLGRSDDMLVVKGLNIYPSAIGSIVAEAGLMYNSPSIQYQILVSKNDPIEKIELLLCNVDMKHADEIRDYIWEESRNKLSVSILSIMVPIIESSGNQKIKRVRRVLE